jgi:arachidonate 15-lipoxygenase
MLLLPHFEGTIFINWGAQASLVNDGGPFDTLFSGTMATNRKVVGDRLGQSFNDSMLFKDLATRGVEDDALFYPYRDDATKLWNAINGWTGSYLATYYKSDKDVENDTELQAWVSELITDGRVKGFGEDDNGKMTTIKYLQEVVTMIIFTASAQHSAVNFSQKDFSGYTPNMPSAGYTPAPTNKDQTEEDWFNLLPPSNMSESQINLAQLLSGVNYTTLGDYGWFYFWDMRLLLPMLQFKANLKNIEKEIKFRNSRSDIIKYDYLLPSKIPQSINI